MSRLEAIAGKIDVDLTIDVGSKRTGRVRISSMSG